MKLLKLLIQLPLCLIALGYVSCLPLANRPNRLEIPVPTSAEPEFILERTGYTLSYNLKENLPNWVAWELNREKLVDSVSRARHFYPDPDIARGLAVVTKDYSNSGWDRGHMCPAADNKWSSKAMRESFYMTNICPQHHNLNRGAWKELEEACRTWADEYGIVYIACGPLLSENVDPCYIGTERQIRVPEAFFKVILLYTDWNLPHAAGFIFQNHSGEHAQKKYLYSVDEVEEMTGLDFFSELPDDEEALLESQIDDPFWH